MFPGWIRTHTQDSIFALQPHLYTRWEVLWDESRHTDSEVDVKTILEFPCRTPRDPVADIQGGRLTFSRLRLRNSQNFDLLLRGSRHNAVHINAR